MGKRAATAVCLGGLVLVSAPPARAAPGESYKSVRACSHTVRGTAADNTNLEGGRGSDRILGLAGDDQMYGEGGPDCLYGGPGDDDLYGGSILNTADVLSAGDGGDILDGGSGNDAIFGAAGLNRIDAGPGNDRIDANNGHSETVRCGSGRDRATLDAGDRALGCETIRRRSSPLPHFVPSRGGRFATFRIVLRAPETLGTHADGSGFDRYVVELRVPRRPGCGRDRTRTSSEAYSENSSVVLGFKPPRTGWCPGTYTATAIHEEEEAETEFVSECQTDNFTPGCKRVEDVEVPTGETIHSETPYGRARFRVR